MCCIAWKGFRAAPAYRSQQIGPLWMQRGLSAGDWRPAQCGLRSRRRIRQWDPHITRQPGSAVSISCRARSLAGPERWLLASSGFTYHGLKISMRRRAGAVGFSIFLEMGRNAVSRYSMNSEAGLRKGWHAAGAPTSFCSLELGKPAGR